MAQSNPQRIDFSQVLKLFPGQEHLVRQLLVRNRLFREVCDDYMAALHSLTWFNSFGDSDKRREVAEFQVLSDSLLAEMRAIVSKNLGFRDTPGP